MSFPDVTSFCDGITVAFYPPSGITEGRIIAAHGHKYILKPAQALLSFLFAFWASIFQSLE